MGYIGVISYNPLILTFDPNFQQDIQVGIESELPLFIIRLPKGHSKDALERSDVTRQRCWLDFAGIAA